MYQNVIERVILDLSSNCTRRRCPIKILVSKNVATALLNEKKKQTKNCILGSLHLHSAAASRVEQALSEVASSMSSFSPRPGPQRAWLLLLEIWLLLAELYLALDQPDDVQQCIQEATQIFPPSHHIMHMVGEKEQHIVLQL